MAKKLQVVSCKPFQSDWDEDNEASVSFIRNKPDISTITKVKNIILYSANWIGEGPYKQFLNIGATSNCKVDVQLDVDRIIVIDNAFKLTVKNDNGIVAIYAIGDKPDIDMPIQLTMTNVARENELDAIWGNII